MGAIILSLVIALEVLSWKSMDIMMWSCKLSPTGKSATTGIYKIENKFIYSIENYFDCEKTHKCYKTHVILLCQVITGS